jgi:hypothetical protein
MYRISWIAADRLRFGFRIHRGTTVHIKVLLCVLIVAAAPLVHAACPNEASPTGAAEPCNDLGSVDTAKSSGSWSEQDAAHERRSDEDDADDSANSGNGVNYDTGSVCVTKGAGGICLETDDD